VPTGGTTLPGAAYALGLLEFPQQRKHLIAIGARPFCERHGRQTVAIGQQLLGGLGTQRLSCSRAPATSFRLRNRFGG
jgi:hypothetical protein